MKADEWCALRARAFVGPVPVRLTPREAHEARRERDRQRLTYHEREQHACAGKGDVPGLTFHGRRVRYYRDLLGID